MGGHVLADEPYAPTRQLYATQPLHAGLVILIPTVNRVVQRRLFKAALDELAIVGEPLDGDQATLTLYDLSAG